MLNDSAKGNTMKRAWIGFILLLIISACSDRNAPEDVAEDFVYNYYLHANQGMALRLSEGLAKEKLKSEIEILRKVRSGSDQSQVKPNLEYKQVGKKIEDENRVFFRYQLIIKGTSFSNTIRNTVIFTELIEGQWKVTNFDEYVD